MFLHLSAKSLSSFSRILTLKVISVSLIDGSPGAVVSQQLIFGHFLYFTDICYLMEVLNRFSHAEETVAIH